MNEFFKNMRKHIAQLKKKKPVYKEILNFYERVSEKQEGIKPTLNVAPIEMREDLRALQIKEGFPLISKEDFTLDIPSSVRLFESLCQIGKSVTDKMKEDIIAIEEAVRNGKLDPEELLVAEALR
jgi:hypothetical protein